MAVAHFLVDTSVLARMGDVRVGEVVEPLLAAGEVATCGAIELEVRRVARNASEYDETAHRRRLAYEWLPTEDPDWRRALEVQQALAHRGQLRAVKLPDLLIAATAERHRVVVLHYDHDFDLIADVSGQPTKWVVAPGSVT